MNKQEPWSGTTVAITGSHGFIGRRLVDRLLDLGATVRGLDLRPDAALEQRQRYSARIGSTTDPTFDDWLLAGADMVLHCAAVVEEDGDPALFEAVNVKATARLAERAAALRVGEFVHLSSVMVYGFRYPEGVTEDGPLAGEGNAYCQTKIDGEHALESLLAAQPVPRLTIIRAGDVFGPRSGPWVIRPTTLMKRGVFALPARGRGIMNAVYVENLIDVILLAAQRESSEPHTFNVVDQAITWGAYFDRLSEAIGVRAAPRIPTPLLRAALAIGERLPIDVGASAASVSFIDRRASVSSQRVRSVLGYTAEITLERALDETVAWLRENHEQLR